MRWMILMAWLAATVMGMAAEEEAEEPKAPLPKVETILERVWANRARKDLALQGQLFVDRQKTVPVEVWIKNLPEEVRTLYRSGPTELLIVQSQKKLPQYYLAGVGELTGDRRMGKFMESWVTYYDLGMPFLYWPEPKLLGTDRTRGQDCYLIEVKSEKEPYRRVKIWVQMEYAAVLRVEAFDVDDNPVKRIGVSSFKRIDGVWIPRGMDFMFVPPGQFLPATERSRLEILEGNYDARLPLERFDPSRFGVKPNAANN